MLLLKVQDRSIKAIAFLILFGLSGYLFNRCGEEESHARSYPRVRTNPVSGITGEGATFNADIYSLGEEQIIDHGFVWSKYSYPDLSDNKILLGPTGLQGAYSAVILTSLSKDVEYTVKSFVQTADHVIYGVPVSFKSLGSGAPVVTGFAPDSAAWLDTIRISGHNFSYHNKENIVKLNQISCNVISATDTLLIIEVSPNVSDLKSLVSVEISGNISVFNDNMINLKVPKITSFTPEKAFWGDTIRIRGKHFRSFNSNSGNTIQLGTVKCQRFGQVTDTSLLIIVPFEVATLRSYLTMKINGLFSTAGNMLELLPPNFTFSPKEGTWGTTITLSGKFNKIATRNTIYFNSNNQIYIKVQPEDIISTTLNTIKIKVPNSVSDIKTTIIYNVDPFNITSKDTFSLAQPVINSFSPVMGTAGTTVTIKGKYFDPLSTEVKFGDTPAGIYSMNDSTIIVAVPSVMTDKVKITVKGRNLAVVSTDYFQNINPKIISVSPLIATFNDEITITGENLTSPEVTFDGLFYADIVSSTSTKIVIRVPLAIDSIPRALYIKCGLTTVISTEKITLSPPQITSITPVGSIQPGQDITITGNNFNPEASYNTVTWDQYLLRIKSSTKTEIIATMPMGIPRNISAVKVFTSGYTRLSSQTISVSNSPWLRLAAPQIPSTFMDGYWGSIIYGQSSKNFGYICSEEGGKTYRFDPSDNSWRQLNLTSPFESSLHYIMMGQVVYKDSIYLIGGHYENAMKMLYDGNSNWKSYPSPVQRSGVAFSLNDKIYFGLDYWNPSLLDFYECNPALNYSWNRINDFPILSSQFSTYFTAGGKGYVVFRDKSVFQFDPSDLIWRRMADFPGAERVLAFSFVLGDIAYIGGGISPSGWGPQPDDLWRFDPVLNIWSLMSYIPGVRYSSVAFSIGAKAYIGFGLRNQDGYPNNLYDFYEFDLNFGAK